MARLCWIFLACSFFKGIRGFIRHIDEKLTRSHLSFQLSDGYMYASRNGPFLLPKGSSSIDLHLDVASIGTKNTSQRLNVVIFGAEEDDQRRPVLGVCSSDMKALKTNTWVKDIDLIKVRTAYQNCDEAGKSCRFQVRVDKSYEVVKEGWYNVIVAYCPEDIHYGSSYSSYSYPATVAQSSADPAINIKGSIAFKNTYGYLPAEAYGLLPFEGIRGIAYLLVTAYYLVHYFVYKHEVVPVHTMLMGLALMVTIEAVLWTAHYFYINFTGIPTCCPYPIYLILLNVMQILDQTLLRLVLLIICLGYGIGRPRLLFMEIVAIIVLHVVYFTAATANQLYYFIHVNSYYNQVKGGEGDFTEGVQYFRSNGLIIFEVVINAILLSWIYLSASSTIRILSEFQQREKLRMYRSLLIIVLVFILLFMTVTLIFVADDENLIDWPWQLRWLQLAIQELLNFAIVTALCVLFKPTDRSRLLAYTSQLPTEDPDEELDEPQHGGTQKHIQRLNFAKSSLHDDDEDELEMVQMRNRQNGKNGKNSSLYNHLPEADDEEYGLSNSD
eukprot:scaffold3595_cov235-Ochromonas_danica.AAC.35